MGERRVSVLERFGQAVGHNHRSEGGVAGRDSLRGGDDVGDRGDPVVQLAPPLISTREDIDFMVGVLRDVFTDAVGRRF